MLHKSPSPPTDKKQSHDTREPDLFKDGDRASEVARRHGSDDDEDEVDDDDIVEEAELDVVDLDATPDGEGPDA